ncbi:MAG: serine acetyltransferase [Ignavibacteriaceae bacterium]
MNSFIKENYSFYEEKFSHIPSISDITELTDMLFQLLFPLRQGMTFNEYEEFSLLAYQKTISVISSTGVDAEKVMKDFFAHLPDLHKKLFDDAEFICESDPAAVNVQEVISIYPGFFAIAAYRIANRFVKLGVPTIPRMITEYAHRQTGIDIHPKAEIGDRFTIDHGTGIVVGETTTIGHNVKLYQGVTLGALSVEKSEASTKRHPTIEDNVIIYAGSTVLGGNTVIGHDSVIGGNVWLTESVLPYSIVYHKSQVKIRNQRDYKEPIDFQI